jgi:xanthine dehydrogenase YagS FAD-binding subunit
MRAFALLHPRELGDPAVASCVTVADAMVAPRGASPSGGSVFKAGGIDLLSLMKDDLVAPQSVVDLRRIAGLDDVVTADGDGLRIGALATLEAVATHPLVTQRYAILADAAMRSGSLQIRNVATVGGNLLQRPHCWYFRSKHHRCLKKGGSHCFAIPGENQYHSVFDNEPCAIVHPSTLATALVALGAELELRGADDARRRVALEKFFVLPRRELDRENDLRAGEILLAVRLPPLPPGARMAYLKQGEKDAFDWPLADAGVLLDLAPDGVCRNAAVILGAAAPAPHRAKAAEKALIGRPIDEVVARQSGRAAIEGATPLAKNAYKLPLFETLVRRAILKAASSA